MGMTVKQMLADMDRQLEEYRTKNEIGPDDDTSYLGWYEEHPCLECGRSINGMGIFSTGKKIIHEANPRTKTKRWVYEPLEGEVLKNIWMECDGCGWNQYS